LPTVGSESNESRLSPTEGSETALCVAEVTSLHLSLQSNVEPEQESVPVIQQHSPAEDTAAEAINTSNNDDMLTTPKWNWLAAAAISEYFFGGERGMCSANVLARLNFCFRSGTFS